MKNRKMILICSLAIAITSAGCVHVAPSTAGVPARNASPLEKALAYNAGLAESNKTIAQAVVNLTSSTPPLIEPEYANKLLVAQSRIADFDRQLTPLLVDAASVKANAAQIQQLLSEIQIAARGIGSDLGIKDANTQTTVSAAISNVIGMADLVLTSLSTAGMLK